LFCVSEKGWVKRTRKTKGQGGKERLKLRMAQETRLAMRRTDIKLPASVISG
jgi:hypothetical protein